MSRPLLLLVLLAAGLALGLRLPRLEQRPMHNDEAVNGVKFGALWETGAYKYDPNEHHGPSLYYATWALGRLTGGPPDIDHFSEVRLRWVTVLFGLGLVLLLPLVADGLGRNGTIWAALFTAVSPAMVFYSRYFIHEMLLVFSAFLALAAGWRYWRSRKIGWAILAGAGLGLMYATKETFVFSVAAAVLALALNQVWNRLLDASGPPVKAPRLNYWHLAAGAGTCALVGLILFTSFFTNAAGPIDSVRTYLPWLHRAEGQSPHIHAWYYYLHHLLWFHAGRGPVFSESLVLVLALVGTAVGFSRKRLAGANASLVRFLAFYSFLLLACYSLIAYKTPWCLLNFWQGFILLAGVGAAALFELVRTGLRKGIVALLLLAGLLHLGWLAWEIAVPYAANQRNPYVYAQTSPDILNLVKKVEALASVTPQGRNMVVKVVSPDSDYWPLPWYLRSFKQVGWWDELPSDPFAPVMVVAANLDARLDEKKTHVMVGYFQLRPQVFLELYVDLNLWRDYLRNFPPSEAE